MIVDSDDSTRKTYKLNTITFIIKHENTEGQFNEEGITEIAIW
jgi:hypothetical protein